MDSSQDLKSETENVRAAILPTSSDISLTLSVKISILLLITLIFVRIKIHLFFLF